jgi:hypothetical protein
MMVDIEPDSRRISLVELAGETSLSAEVEGSLRANTERTLVVFTGHKSALPSLRDPLPGVRIVMNVATILSLGCRHPNGTGGKRWLDGLEYPKPFNSRQG